MSHHYIVMTWTNISNKIGWPDKQTDRVTLYTPSKTLLAGGKITQQCNERQLQNGQQECFI